MSLGLGASLTRTLSTTNPIENLNGLLRSTTRRVRRWDDGTMVLRWALVGVLEATRGFRRLKGHKDMNLLVAHLKQLGQSAAQTTVDDERSAA